MSILVNRGHPQSRVPCQNFPQQAGTWNDLLRNRNLSSPLKPHRRRPSLPKDKRRPNMQQNAPIVPAAFKVFHHAKDVDCCFLRTGRCSKAKWWHRNIWLILKIRFCNLVDTQCEKWKSEPRCWINRKYHYQPNYYCIHFISKVQSAISESPKNQLLG